MTPPASLRAVRRAANDLRRGIPVVLSGSTPLVLLAAETVIPGAIEELVQLAGEPPVLLVTPVRAAALLQRPVISAAAAVALPVPLDFLSEQVIPGLADPTIGQPPRLEVEPILAPPSAAAALSLLKLARLLPAAIAASADPKAADTAAGSGLLTVTAEDVLGYRTVAAVTLRRVAEAEVPLEGAENTRVVAFRTEDGAVEHLAIIVGDPTTHDAPLVRLHSECFTGDLLGSLRCDCGQQLRGAIARMKQDSAGVVLYLAQEGRGIGLPSKLRAYALQDRGLDTLDANRALGWGADERSFASSAAMLNDLGLTRIRLLTNNPDKVAALRAHGVEVLAREPHAFPPNGVNDGYLATKARRFGHLLD